MSLEPLSFSLVSGTAEVDHQFLHQEVLRPPSPLESQIGPLAFQKSLSKGRNREILRLIDEFLHVPDRHSEVRGNPFRVGPMSDHLFYPPEEPILSGHHAQKERGGIIVF